MVMERQKLRPRGSAARKQEEWSAPSVSTENESRKRGILESLEMDNFQADPHAEFTWHKSIPHKLSTGFNVQAPSSRIPPRKICFICGNTSRYTCPKCGIQHCSLECNELHKDTRSKWSYLQ
ncbi:HIT zinc finger family protein [Trichuris trichiura]|uniref:HIT zinc finger family protein n=1 Tax=Trichuris trichiura TaxID=36087 RepID=A0A077Z8M9_TRITR|nr:HIT zinc finger family protein [Trichuris trichiura]